MYVQELHLEMTRNCTLYCEHCLRGNKKSENINVQTIDNVFKNVTGVYNLLLTGGEPLIAVRELEYLIEVLKERKISIGRITLITNGTIMSARVLKILKELCSITYCHIDVSGDIFHKLELQRLGLMELRNKNFEVLKRLFGSEEHGISYEKSNSYLSCVGRAEKLSSQRLSFINSMIEGNYIVKPGVRTMNQPETFIHNGNVFGYLSIDVNGNIVSYGQSYSEEDEESKRICTNVNKVGFTNAVNNFIKYLDDKLIIAAPVILKK